MTAAAEAPGARSGWRRAVVVDLVLAGTLALAVVGPLLLGRGFWLVGDMVFVPHQPWKAAWLGLDDSLPRAVPMDALLSLASYVVPGEWLQRLLLAGGLVAGGTGTGRLLGEHRAPARAAGIVLFLWNPWVLERLLIGQWAILLGYLLLPWVALAARRLRADPRTGWRPAGAALVAAAVCSPSSGVMAVVVLAVLGLGRDRAGWWRCALVAVVANLPWVVPSLTATTVEVSAEGVFEGFAARGESSLGVVASLASLGGIWKSSIVPDARGSAALVALSCVLTAAALAGLRRAVRSRDRELPRWAVLGAGAFLVAALPAVPAGADALGWLGERQPAVALLRDSHRFLAPLGLVLAVGLAGATTAVLERVRQGREALVAVAGLLAVAPVLLLPGLAWGAGGELRTATYPDGWEEVADVLADDPGTTVVLPWAGAYRGFDWNDRRAVLDPAPRFLPGEVVVDDRVILDDVVVPAEDPRVVAVDAALSAEDPAAALREVGVRWVLVEEDTAPVALLESPDGTVRVDRDGLRLVDLGSPSPAPDDTSRTRLVLVTAADTGAVMLLFSAVGLMLPSGSDRRHKTRNGPGEDRARR